MAAITGLDPSVLIAPDYQTQMMQAQRRLALSQQLQQMALQDTPGNGGSISWTQGLARLADGLVSGLAAKKGYAQMKGANQAYAAGLARRLGVQPPTPPQAPQMGQGAPPASPSPPMPQQPPQAPQQAPVPFTPGQAPAAGQPDPLAPLPDAPPQAATPPPSAPSPAPTGGAYPMSLTGDPQKDLMLYMENPDEFSKALIANASKGAAPTDLEVTLSHAREALAKGDVATASTLLANVNKTNYIAPTNGRPGGWTIYPDGHKEFNPQAPIPGAVPGPPDANGNATWRVPQGTEEAVAARAKSQSAGQSSGAAPYQFKEVFNPATGQMDYVPVSQMVGQGGGSLNAHYGRGGSQGAPSHGTLAAGPPLGAAEAAATYGKGSAQGALDTQSAANGSQIRVQSYREMERLIDGGLQTGPARHRMQELAEEHGLSFLAQDNAFVFNKDAAIAGAAQAQALGLNSSDARVSLVTQANPNLKMPPAALRQVLPVKIGMEYATQAQATANANFIAQHGPQSNPQFNNWWRQNYDPTMFTAYAKGGPKALAQAPANVRQKWLSEYRNLKSMGVDFGQFAQ